MNRVEITVATIVVSIAIPSGWNTTVVVGTAEAVAGTRSLGTGRVVLVGIVATVVVSIAKPERFHANVGRVAFEMARRTGGVAGASIAGLVRRVGIFAVVDPVTNLKCHYGKFELFKSQLITYSISVENNR